MSLNKWELEEDNDSDFSAEDGSNRPLSNSRSRGNQRLDRDRGGPQAKSSNAYSNRMSSDSRRSNASSASRGLYSDDDDDLDEEELPEGSTSKSAEWVGSSSRGNEGNYTESSVGATRKSTYALKPVVVSKSHPSDDEITFEELREAFSETEARSPSGRAQGSEVEVDKIELARAIRYIGVPALADDILNLPARKVSWVALTTVAKPYTSNSRQGPAKPAKPENATLQNSLNSFGPNAGPSGVSRHDLTDTKAKRLSVAFVALDSDEEEEQLRAKHGSRSPTSHKASSIPASTAPSSSSSNWSSQARQPRDAKITKSMEQESWHDNDRSQDLSGSNQRNVDQSSESAESPLRGSRVVKSNVHGLSDSNNSRQGSPDRYHNPSPGKGSRSHNCQRSPGDIAGSQRRWDSKDDDGDSDRDGYDSRSDEGDVEEEDGFEEQRMISPIRSDTDNHGNRLERKMPYDPLDLSPKRVMTSSPVLDGPGPGLRSPPLPPKPTRLSHSPNTVKSSRPEHNYLNASNDSSFFSGPHPLASSWETAISQSYEGGQGDDSPKTTGLPPKKPPRPRTMAQSLEPRGRPDLVSPGGKAMSLSHNGKNTQVKRSISWSAAVSSSHMKPPRPKSTGSLMSSSFASSSMESDGGLSADHDYDAYVSLPPLSEYAERTGVIIEGWLEKKSARTGFWQKRFFVLSESSEEFCVMRIYYKIVESSWGLVPLRKKATIPIGSMRGVSSVSSKIKQGKQFSLTFTSTEKEKVPLPRSRKGSDATNASKGAHDQGDMSEWGDSDGEGDGDGMIKSMILKADDLKTRMLWTAMLEKVLHLYNDEGVQ